MKDGRWPVGGRQILQRAEERSALQWRARSDANAREALTAAAIDGPPPAAAPLSYPENRYPIPGTECMYVGFSASGSILRRSRYTWASTVRVSISTS